MALTLSLACWKAPQHISSQHCKQLLRRASIDHRARHTGGYRSTIARRLPRRQCGCIKHRQDTQIGHDSMQSRSDTWEPWGERGREEEQPEVTLDKSPTCRPSCARHRKDPHAAPALKHNLDGACNRSERPPSPPLLWSTSAGLSACTRPLATPHVLRTQRSLMRRLSHTESTGIPPPTTVSVPITDQRNAVFACGAP